MAGRRFVVDPPIWSHAELAAARALAQARFVEDRQNEGPRAFELMYDEVLERVLDALSRTDDLLRLDGSLLVGDRVLFQTLRNFCGPPISEEDLWSLVGRKFKAVPPGVEEDVAVAIRTVIDRVRFPWVHENRKPAREERERAIQSTTVLIASGRIATVRRGASSRRQEKAVADALEAAGFSFEDVGAINFMEDLTRGTFCHEKTIKGSKCDVPARLRDGRLLALECKVSNGPKNSWKRVNREAGDKSQTWSRGFGEDVITGVVLAGNFDQRCVVQAQESSNLTIFWEHDLGRLTEFASQAV